jgi:hypothetical protein
MLDERTITWAHVTDDIGASSGPSALLSACIAGGSGGAACNSVGSAAFTCDVEVSEFDLHSDDVAVGDGDVLDFVEGQLVQERAV